MKFVDATKPAQGFAELGFSDLLLSSLAGMSITKPTEIQARSMPVMLGGQDLIAVSETGSGKTLAYALPIMHELKKNPQARALVIAPTREVALQIFGVFESLGLEPPVAGVVVIGGEKGNKHDKLLRKIPSLIVATPGRLNDLLRNNKLLLKGLTQLVIDEADVMLDMGFSPQLNEIHATLRGTRQTVMVSASFTKKVETVAQMFMQSENVVMIRPEGVQKPVESLTQRVIFMAPGMKNQALQDEINDVTGSVIVFAGNQEASVTVGRYLREYSHNSDFVHGGLEQSIRTKVLNKFREGKIRILVTTDLLARGLDVPSVELVVNYDLPPQAEDFVHRIGRTARMGRKGTAVTFVTSHELRLYKQVRMHLEGAQEITIDPKFSFVGDVAGTVLVPKMQSKRKKSGADNLVKKKKKYGKLKSAKSKSS